MISFLKSNTLPSLLQMLDEEEIQVLGEEEVQVFLVGEVLLADEVVEEVEEVGKCSLHYVPFILASKSFV
jgi:hypothetical protein